MEKSETLSGLHFILTYTCLYECDHCFLCSSPRALGTFTLDNLERAFEQALDAGVTSVYFEGGEPFLYYPKLLEALRMAKKSQLQAGLVTNCYLDLMWSILGRPPVVGSMPNLETPSIEPTSDGFVGFTTYSAQQMSDFLLMIERDDLRESGEFSQFAQRLGNLEAWEEVVHAYTRAHTTAEIVDLAQVMIAQEKSSLAFHALTQVRNKLISAYQEIMNMPV